MAIKNVNEIKSEAKEQIKVLLDRMECYEYSDEGIDKWLRTWEKACEPQITQIAEKSPYYDGKCKIVFPSEYPRTINSDGIHTFCKWLKTFAVRNMEPCVFDTGFGTFTEREIKDIRQIRSLVDNLRNYYTKLDTDFDLVLPTEINTSLVNLFDDNYSRKASEFFSAISGAYTKIEYDDCYIRCDGVLYDRTEYLEGGAYYANKLGSMLEMPMYHQQFLTEEGAYNINYWFPEAKAKEGQKLSRAVSAVARKYGITQDKEWERAFAKYADSINPLTIKRWTVISWHPIDYLTFCFGHSWSTCSTIDKRNVRGVKIGDSRSSVTNYVDEDYTFRGEHCAATMSYMFDKTSFIYYTVSSKYEGEHYEEQDKQTRIVFSLNEEMDTLLQSRLYPQCNDDVGDGMNYQIPREIVQKVIAEALGKPNLWKMRKGSGVCTDYAHSIGVHYADYRDERNKECNISWLTSSTETPKIIKLGHNGICPKCGCAHTHLSSLNCTECDPDYY